MAEKTEKKKRPVSPVNGQPTPRGKPFTSESAREAARKKNAKYAAQKSITAAFLELMSEIVTVDKNGKQYTGAQAIAQSIVRGAMKGSPEMVKISLALCGETPSTKITVESGQLAELIDGLKEPVPYDLYSEATGNDGAVED